MPHVFDNLESVRESRMRKRGRIKTPRPSKRPPLAVHVRGSSEAARPNNSHSLKPFARTAHSARLREAPTSAAALTTAGFEQDPEYAGKFSDVNEEATDALEQEARRRALEGIEEPVFYKGERVGSIRKFSDQLLMLLLMAKRPNQFRERVDVTSKVDHGFAIDPKIMKTLSDEELAMARTLAKKLTGPKEESSS